MGRKKAVPASTSPFTRVYSFDIGNFTISRGDIIKIDGEHGVKFKFDSVVTDPRTGNTWIDCFELEKGIVSRFRSFTMSRVKRIPTRRKRVSRR
jgi:hypothetical protein